MGLCRPVARNFDLGVARRELQNIATREGTPRDEIGRAAEHKECGTLEWQFAENLALTRGGLVFSALRW